MRMRMKKKQNRKQYLIFQYKYCNIIRIKYIIIFMLTDQISF